MNMLQRSMTFFSRMVFKVVPNFFEHNCQSLYVQGWTKYFSQLQLTILRSVLNQFLGRRLTHSLKSFVVRYMLNLIELQEKI